MYQVLQHKDLDFSTQALYVTEMNGSNVMLLQCTARQQCDIAIYRCEHNIFHSILPSEYNLLIHEFKVVNKEQRGELNLSYIFTLINL